MLESCSCVRFYHAETAECKALQDKHLPTSEYLHTTTSTSKAPAESSLRVPGNVECIDLSARCAISHTDRVISRSSNAPCDCTQYTRRTFSCASRLKAKPSYCWGRLNLAGSLSRFRLDKYSFT